MRNIFCRSFIIVSVFFIVLFAAGQSMSLQVRTAELRDTPNFFGKPLASVSYAELLEVIAQKGEWIRVKTAYGTMGWLHKSALTSKPISMASGAVVQIPAEKALNADIEAVLKTKHSTISYTPVDAMEAIVVPPPELAKFIYEGELTPLP